MFRKKIDFVRLETEDRANAQVQGMHSVSITGPEPDQGTTLVDHLVRNDRQGSQLALANMESGAPAGTYVPDASLVA
ncbi:hypothetical protein [Mesorhizobium sp. B1-1-8]|uniref:hypothetical protein n=1 Tax=Mesorhizobium sp. B1-1-8 TaxID=2589976 RepID=UPI00112A1365|nr:hypothetical protein [Mesorhizobium sp. B1-1-8]UCI09658.1 hypothetical protein FJ974_11680 [Mesorhizobium sp. B1-1-8]